jgi:6-phosphogluconate dehydrogenase
MNTKQQFGLIGLGVMGQNFILNVERNGFGVVAFNRTAEKTKAFVEGPAVGKNIIPAYTVGEFTGMLETPRRIMLLVKAGPAVDATIDSLLPHLDAGDLIIDGGNSFFADSERRAKALEEKGVNFLGMGVSGGEEGALWGPSLMPGGTRQAWEDVRDIMTKAAAKTSDGEACVTYIGPGGAGHYVKMVHNGIEYGDMQLIAEAYHLLKSALGLSAKELSEIFARWNDTDLSSYLIEITAKVLAKVDDDSGQPLVDVILDAAGQKGTGKWTTQSALDLGAAVPTITAAVDARIVSSSKDERIKASKVLRGPSTSFAGDPDKFVDNVRDALHASKIASYAQGMALLRTASDEHGWDIDLAGVAKIWREGCIIRARLLDDISSAFSADPALPNLLLDNTFQNAIVSRQDAWRSTVMEGLRLGVPLPGMSSSLAWFDAYRSERLPANLIQGQRDLFGAHTYERTDRPGTFHTDWS